MASAYLTKTFSSSGTRTTWTFSCWIKRSAIGSQQDLFVSLDDASNYTHIRLQSDDTMQLDNISGGSNTARLTTNRVFRDTNAWYHIVWVADTTNATTGDRIRCYINGTEETSFSTETQPSQSTSLFLNQNKLHSIGRNPYSSGTSYFDGLMTHIHFTDGYAYAGSDFGETDSTSGIWKPKTAPSVTYGTNGFFLDMADSSALGDDESGNTNDFTVNGTITQTEDTPSNNFATMNALDNYYANHTFSNGNTTTVSDHPAPITSTLGVSSGKWYIEAKAVSSTAGDDWQIGIISTQVTATSHEIGNFSNDYGYVGASGKYRTNNANTTYGNAYTAGDIIGVAIDLDNNKLYFSKNGTWQNSGDPTSGATGTGAISITDASSTSLGNYFIAVGANASVNSYTWSMNFGNGRFGTTALASSNSDSAGLGLFEYSVPSGYYALCTKNIKNYG